nr:helix-turn-helix domain-containing protein [Nitrospiraceae bacterium]
LARELSQQELARLIQKELGKSISQSYLSQIENGARPHLTNPTRMLLAKFFKVHPGYLVDDPEGFETSLRTEMPAGPDRLRNWLSAQAEELLEMAHKKGLKIMVDHTFLFTGAVKKIKELVDQGVLGDLFYYDSMRVNLGLFQHDVNVVWDLAPHDLSVMDYVIKSKPLAISATGMDHFGRKTENIAYITVYLEDNAVAHFNVNWLSPVKIRTTLIGGSKRMAVWNDLEADEKVKIYDKGIDIGSREGIYNLLVNYRSGDMWAPKLERAEALKTESEYFVNCIMNGVQPINDGHAGLRVVRMLEASDSSIRARGRIVEL